MNFSLFPSAFKIVPFTSCHAKRNEREVFISSNCNIIKGKRLCNFEVCNIIQLLLISDASIQANFCSSGRNLTNHTWRWTRNDFRFSHKPHRPTTGVNCSFCRIKWPGKLLLISIGLGYKCVTNVTFLKQNSLREENDKSRKKIFPDEIFMIVHSVKLFYLLADSLVNCVPEPVPRYLYYWLYFLPNSTKRHTFVLFKASRIPLVTCI